MEDHMNSLLLSHLTSSMLIIYYQHLHWSGYLFKPAVPFINILLLLNFRQVLYVSGRWIQNWSECITLCGNFSTKTTEFFLSFCLFDFCRGDRVLTCISDCAGIDCINENSFLFRCRSICLCFLSAAIKSMSQYNFFFSVEIVHTISLMHTQYYWSVFLSLYVC